MASGGAGAGAGAGNNNDDDAPPIVGPQLAPRSRFVVDTPTDLLNSSEFGEAARNTAIEMSSATAQLLVAKSGGDEDDDDDIELENYDFIKVRGIKSRFKLMGLVIDERVPYQHVTLNDLSCKYLGVSPGDGVLLEYVEDYEFITAVQIAPIVESMKCRSKEQVQRDLEDYIANAKVQLPMYQGDVIRVGGVLYKVTELKVDGYEDLKYGEFVATNNAGVNATQLAHQDPISTEECDKDLQQIGYSDIGGLRDQLDNIRETVEVPLRFPEIYTRMGTKLPKGVLMSGPPGCGKTLIAKAIANECHANFMNVSGPELISSQQGGTQENIKKLFDEARAKAPTLLFIDEIDSIAPNRAKTPDPKLQQVVAALLVELDGNRDDAHVIVIAATNRPRSVDPAITRKGRFDKEIVIPVPSEPARLEILTILSRNQTHDDDVNLKKIAKETHGFVGADLANLTMKAAIHCIRRNAAGVIDLEEDDIPPDFIASLRINMADFMKALSNAAPSSLKGAAVEKPNISFDDIGGLEAVKAELKELVTMPVQYADDYEAMGQKPRRGILMYGLPGCGKTMLAAAMANEVSCNFVAVTGTNLMSQWFGESEEKIRDIFQTARQSAPCIMFFDELDSIGKQRGGFNSWSAGGAGDKMVNQLLVELQGVGKSGQIFVVGATNRPHLLDKALVRTGRLDMLVEIPMPDPPARRATFKACLRNTPVSRDCDIDKLADELDKYNGSDIANICKTATKIAVRGLLAQRAANPHFDDSEFMLRPEHFQLAKENCRRSLSDADIATYRRHVEDMINRMGSGSGLTQEEGVETVGDRDEAGGGGTTAAAAAAGGASAATDAAAAGTGAGGGAGAALAEAGPGAGSGSIYVEPGYYKMHQEALLEADADADDDDDALLYPSN